MNITSAKFVTSVGSTGSILKDDLPKIAFVGRSNVGKSSLLNRLCNKGKLAKTSSTPGRTRLINYFLVNDKFYFVIYLVMDMLKLVKQKLRVGSHL